MQGEDEMRDWLKLFGWILKTLLLGLVSGIIPFIGPAFVGMGFTGLLREEIGSMRFPRFTLFASFVVFATTTMVVVAKTILFSSSLRTHVMYGLFVVTWFWLTYLMHDPRRGSLGDA